LHFLQKTKIKFNFYLCRNFEQEIGDYNMPKTSNMYSCDLCGHAYQMGAGIYDGKYIPRYDLNVCMPCYNGNWDGWSPNNEKLLIAHLKKKGLPMPERNEKRWLPRD
jgi:hypothetical protein